MSIATSMPRTAGPLAPEHHRDLALAAERAIPIRSAARVATMNAWITGIIAAMSAPFALFSLTGFVVAVGLSIVAWNEFRGRRRLLRFEPSAATFLAGNQLGFLALIIVYCLWSTYTILIGPNPLVNLLSANSELLAPEDRRLLTSSAELVKYIAIVFYGLVIVLSVIFQGAMAAYYATRRKYVERYVAETPEWIRDLHRTTLPA